jgi:hypothetical protein
VPGYWTPVHHVNGWAVTGRTDINELTLTCGPDNRLAETTWTTHKNAQGETEWIPPPHLDYGQPRSKNPPCENHVFLRHGWAREYNCHWSMTR